MGSYRSPSSISQQLATIAAIVPLLLGTGICGPCLRLCRTYKGRAYWRCSQGGYRSLADLDIRKNCHPCKKLCRSDGKRIFWAFRRLQPALDCCCRLRVGEWGVGTVRQPAVTGEPCRVRGLHRRRPMTRMASEKSTMASRTLPSGTSSLAALLNPRSKGALYKAYGAEWKWIKRALLDVSCIMPTAPRHHVRSAQGPENLLDES